MGFWDVVYYVLYLLGLYRKSATIVLLGLDNAGKTTLLYKLRDGVVKSFIQTQRAAAHEIQLGALSIKAWDLGGHEVVRELWADYFAEADAIVYMVDGADHGRFEESRVELESLMQVPQLAKAPIAVLVNKKDLPHAISREELIRAFALEGAIASRERPLQVFSTSTFSGSGYGDAFRWLSSLL